MYGLSAHDTAMAQRQRRETERVIDAAEAERLASLDAAKTAADALALEVSRDVFVYRRDTGGYRISVTQYGMPLYTAHDLPF